MRYYDFQGWSGCVTLRRSRTTGHQVGVYHAKQAGLDPAGGPWVTTCEYHATLCNHETLELAMAHLPYAEWCEACQEELRKKAAVQYETARDRYLYLREHLDDKPDGEGFPRAQALDRAEDQLRSALVGLGYDRSELNGLVLSIAKGTSY